ncbi:muscarinic acetylcholine receptor M3-like [Rhopilema esculentum]|uniref:muscarinic acetylcholine receptor M3-like n=1 Tax=Rhopilema esculentum TaxID=499914 RepID=UPI0031DA33BA
MTTNRNMTVTEEGDWSFQCRDIFTHHNRTYTYPLTNAFVQFSYAIGIINCSAVPFTIVCNLILIVAIRMNKRLQTKTNFVILSLLVSNLLVGLFSLPSHGAFVLLVAMRISNCAIRAFTSIFSSTVAVTSILLTILLSYERYTALKKPFLYASKFTNKKIFFFAISSWLLAFAIILGAETRPTAMYASIIMSLVMLIGYVYNIFVHLSLRKAVRRIRRNQVTIKVANEDVNLAAEQEKARKESRTNRFTAYVIGLQLIFNLPAIIVYSSLSYSGQGPVPFYIVDTIMCLHATVSPALYLWQSPGLFKAVQHLFNPSVSVQE